MDRPPITIVVNVATTMYLVSSMVVSVVGSDVLFGGRLLQKKTKCLCHSSAPSSILMDLTAAVAILSHGPVQLLTNRRGSDSYSLSAYCSSRNN